MAIALWQGQHTGWRWTIYDNPWEALQDLGRWLWAVGQCLPKDYATHTPGVWIAPDAVVARDVVIEPPCILCEGAVVRSGAYLRGNVWVGKKAVVGHCTEVKNAVLFDEAQAPHYNYVGDSILGYKAHLGAGVICCNLRLDQASVRVLWQGQLVDTKLRKLGALVGDEAQVGAGSVLCPGVVVQARAVLPPLCVGKHIIE